ncbi:MAG: ABC transporter permease [Candidatus Accumulibacter sp.]|jgi:peptide/nickel transport system permease protein|nr:ABC transporter permease [Accumulibacter sp.]
MSALGRVRATLWRTFLQAIPTVFGIVILVFLLLQLVPGDAADVLAGESGGITEEGLAMLRARFGLDQPIVVQLLAYLNHLAHFSLGYSPRYNAPVMDLIMSRLPGTLILMLLSQFIAIAAGIALGAVMATWAGQWPDRLLSLAALLLYSTPGFWIGLMALVVFSVWFGWLPSGGDITIGADLRGWAHVKDFAAHAVLPVTALAGFFVAIYARLVRASMLEISRQDFVRTAHAKGLAPFVVSVRHILRCALAPLVTVAGLHLGTMLGGAVVIETVFSWPGLGRLALEAVMARDYTVLLGILLLSSLTVIVANMLVDLLHAWLDPRIKPR